MSQPAHIAAALRTALPAHLHAHIPALAQVLAEALTGQTPTLADPGRIETLRSLQGTNLPVPDGTITVGAIHGENIAIGHQATAQSATGSAIAQASGGSIALVITVAPPHPQPPPAPQTEHERRNRAAMLQKVHDFWVRGVLEASLHQAALIDLAMEYQPDAVVYPWEKVVARPQARPKALPAGTSIASAFDEMGSTEMDGALLILGAPGSGKTTMLLELARTLIARAQADEILPIPVVFNLSSWAEKHPPLTTWLVEELNLRYDVPREVGQAWIDQDQVLPLLDGLDEVREQVRDQCVTAINTYREKHGMVGMAVCSRMADYANLAAKLKLHGAVVLQPLTNAQIDTYLAQAGEQIAAVRTRLNEDTDLRHLAETPLMLNILTLAYQEMPLQDLREHASLDARRRHLFATYVERMLQRRPFTQQNYYTPEQTKRWLNWLACRMVEQGQTPFYLEQMQIHWLDRWWQRGLYVLFSALGAGASFAVVGSFIGMLAMPFWYLQSYWSQGHTGMMLVDIGLIGSAYGFICGMGGFIAGLIVSLGHWTNRRCQPWQPLCYGALVYGILVVPTTAVCLLVGIEQLILLNALLALPPALTISLLVESGQIGLLKSMRWSWAKLTSRWYRVAEAVAGTMLVCVVMYGWIHGAGRSLAETLSEGLQIGLVYAIVFGIGVTLVIGQANVELRQQRYPHEAIWHSLRQALGLWLLVAIVLLLVVAGLRTYPAGYFLSLCMGFSAGMYLGGLAFVQHFALRLVCAFCGYIPWNYMYFLNYATERIFLRHVGGGYIFIHRTLLEYFADMNQDGQADTRAERSS